MPYKARPSVESKDPSKYCPMTRGIHTIMVPTIGMIEAKPVRIPPLFYSVGYLVYGELYIHPHPNLEWYFEMGINSANNSIPVNFRSATGINWYLHEL